MKNLLTILAITAMMGAAHAGGTSHGGDAVRCPGDRPGDADKVYLFDYFLGSDMNPGLVPDLGGAKLNYLQKAELVVRRLAKLDPVAMQVYVDRIHRFEKEAGIMKRSQIPEINDEKSPVSLKSPCYKIQWAIQIRMPRLYEPRYMIDGELWAMANEDAKAGLVVHEVVYTEPIFQFAQKATSDGVRIFNLILASKEIENLNPMSYLRLVSQYQLFQDPRETVPPNLGLKIVNRQLATPLGRALEISYHEYNGDENWKLNIVARTKFNWVKNADSYYRNATFRMASDGKASIDAPIIVETVSNTSTVFLKPKPIRDDLVLFYAYEATVISKQGTFHTEIPQVTELKAKDHWFKTDVTDDIYPEDLLNFLKGDFQNLDSSAIAMDEHWSPTSLFGKFQEGSFGDISMKYVRGLKFDKDLNVTQVTYSSSKDFISTNLIDIAAGELDIEPGTTFFTQARLLSLQNPKGAMEGLKAMLGSIKSLSFDKSKNVRSIVVYFQEQWNLTYNGQIKRMKSGTTEIKLNEKGQIVDPVFKLPKD